MADGIDPGIANKAQKRATVAAAANTSEVVALAWLGETEAERIAGMQDKITNSLEREVFPFICPIPISIIGPRDVQAAVRKMEARGAIDSAHWLKHVCNQIFRTQSPRAAQNGTYLWICAAHWQSSSKLCSSSPLGQ